MAYKSAIEIMEQAQQAIDKAWKSRQQERENYIWQEVQRMGISIDKDELLRALRYDQHQYYKGYKDRDDQIIRCKDCKYNGDTLNCKLASEGMDTDDEWFCADGERSEKEERADVL